MEYRIYEFIERTLKNNISNKVTENFIRKGFSKTLLYKYIDEIDYSYINKGGLFLETIINYTVDTDDVGESFLKHLREEEEYPEEHIDVDDVSWYFEYRISSNIIEITVIYVTKFKFDFR